jgi:phospholipid/cholesterol/gamma-HCH transport system substrate-binding protein
METRANYVLIGGFTLFVIGAAFAFMYWFSSLGHGGVRDTYRIVFDGAVSGLRPGASVLFNGIKVGEVASLRLNEKNPRQVIATIAIERTIAGTDVPIRSDTQVGLDFAGLTGVASISLTGGAEGSAALPVAKDGPPILIADPNATADVTQAARDVLRRIDVFIAENEQPLKATLQNFESFTGSLAQDSGRINEILAGIQNLTGGGNVKGEFAEAAQSLRALANGLDKRTAELSAGLSKFTGSGLREWEALAVDGRRTLSEVERAVKNLDRNPQRVLFGGGNAVPEYDGRR